jgi:hypothetical protein
MEGLRRHAKTASLIYIAAVLACSIFLTVISFKLHGWYTLLFELISIPLFIHIVLAVYFLIAVLLKGKHHMASIINNSIFAIFYAGCIFYYSAGLMQHFDLAVFKGFMVGNALFIFNIFSSIYYVKLRRSKKESA